MIVVMSPSATPTEVEAVTRRLRADGRDVAVSRGSDRVVVGVVGDTDDVDEDGLRQAPGVVSVARLSCAHELVTRDARPSRSTVWVGGVPIGPGRFTLIAGPCAVETPEQTLEAALMARQGGAALLRGGAYKPRSSPYAFQGLGRGGLEILAAVGAEVGLPVVTEVVDTADVDAVAAHADMLQIGARNMQNFALLRAVGRAGKPVLLKRGLTATVDEWLLAAEYVAHAGTLDIVLCERGVRTFDQHARNTLDVSVVPTVQRLSHLPVVVDPSHAGGRRDLVIPLSRAAIGAGADGLMVDVHPAPEEALCDGAQALRARDLRELRTVLRRFPRLMDRVLIRAPEVTGAVAKAGGS